MDLKFISPICLQKNVVHEAMNQIKLPVYDFFQMHKTKMITYSILDIHNIYTSLNLKV